MAFLPQVTNAFLQPVSDVAVFLDPSYRIFSANCLFDVSDSCLNRDSQLVPVVRLKERLEAAGIPTNTADLMDVQRINCARAYYSSLGILPDLDALRDRENVVLDAFAIMEHPVVAPKPRHI